MAEISDEFHGRARHEAETRRRVDFADLQDELEGRDTGRMRRFLSPEASGNRDPHKRAEVRNEQLSRLQRLLAGDPVYAALYSDTFDKLREAENAADKALALASAAKDKAQRLLQETLDRAQRLQDGTRVFRDTHGAVWTEHGGKVSEEIAASIHWRGDEPGYQTFLERSESAEVSFTRLEALQGSRVDTLGKIREELSDEDRSPTSDRLQEMQGEIEVFQQEIERLEQPEAHQAAAPQSIAEPVNTANLKNLDIPQL